MSDEQRAGWCNVGTRTAHYFADWATAALCGRRFGVWAPVEPRMPTCYSCRQRKRDLDRQQEPAR